MIKVKIISSSGSVRNEEASLCLGSGIVKFLNPEGKHEFAHIVSFAMQGARLIEIEKVLIIEKEIKKENAEPIQEAVQDVPSVVRSFDIKKIKKKK